MESHHLSPMEIQALREIVLGFPAAVSLLDQPKIYALIAALGIQQEIGTIHDELSRFIYHPQTGEAYARERFRAELVKRKDKWGVRIRLNGQKQGEDFDIRLRGFRELLHPSSFRDGFDSPIFQIVLFPESIALISEQKGLDLVLVRDWALNTIFGGFDRSRPYYETNAWELVRNDTLQYSTLLAHRQIAFLGTHDLTAHIAGVLSIEMKKLVDLGISAHRRLKNYFRELNHPSVATLILPYTCGVILDDLAQPRNYNSRSRQIVLEEILSALDQHLFHPKENGILAIFPGAYVELIQLARSEDSKIARSRARPLIEKMIAQIRAHSAKRVAS